MTANKKLLSTIILTFILAGGIISIAPNAYSTYYNDDDEDDDHDDDHHEETCECKKPKVFSVIYNGPGIENGAEGTADEPVTVEIYKKLDDVGKEGKKLVSFPNIVDGDSIVLDANSFGKKKINSNTVYHIIQGDDTIATVSFHTSCSQPLFIGDMHTDGPVTITVESGFDHKGRQSIFLQNDPLCQGDTPVVIPAKVTFFNSITTDNGVALPDESSFGYGITGVTNPVFSSTHEVTPDTPITISMVVPDGFTRVMISGDGCPSAADFAATNSVSMTFDQGEELVCTVYHDDNGDGASGGSGVIFHFANQQFSLNGGVQQTGTGNICGDVTAGPCITIDGQNVIVVPDLSGTGQELTDTTIVIFTIIPIGAHVNPMVEPPQAICTFDGLGEPFDNGALLGFRLNCQAGLDGNTSFNVNYALIETA
ncbi:MAG: hypothetical protein DWQ18_04625 [Crenarchaeota archaeon]|nr:MAG: hypothetical protein DWQ17_08505 [Thermoproteota archaeon]RDJ34184.1 MAG: hypothetical protein DWQ18_04625 [Thermoproteota archaeon]RDJ36701.1 MAG: hypothetical protein DWQ13_05985 [Thermoproteota archaeon]RDJ37766.1 MAG: hypothetical protein DWQ19_04850 [Thermoproteota archaeon]